MTTISTWLLIRDDEDHGITVECWPTEAAAWASAWANLMLYETVGECTLDQIKAEFNNDFDAAWEDFRGDSGNTMKIERIEIKPEEQEGPTRRSADTTHQPTNNQRALRAKTALNTFVNGDGDAGTVRDNISDLLANLRHLCDAQSVDFDDVVMGSAETYEEKISEQPKADVDYFFGDEHAELKFDEPILADDYPVYAGYNYVADGEVVVSHIEGSVKRLKLYLKATEIKRCDLKGRGFV